VDDEYPFDLAKTEYREGYRTGDAERVLSIFSQGAIVMPDGVPTFGGEEHIRAMRGRLKKLFAEYSVDVALVIADYTIHGDFCFEWGWEGFTFTPKAGGEPTKQRFRYVWTWKKESDNKWRVTKVLTNKDLPPANAPAD